MPLVYREVYRYVLGCGGSAVCFLLAIFFYRSRLTHSHAVLGPDLFHWGDQYLSNEGNILYYDWVHNEPILLAVVFLILAVVLLLVAILYPSKEVKQMSGIDKKAHK